IMTLAEDTLRSLPRTLRDGGEALGLTKQETIKRVLMPAAKAGLGATLMFAFARAVGETMIVWILSGGAPKLPSALKDVFGPTRGMADTIAVEMGNVAFEEQHYGHLFLLGMSLFVITLVINLVAFKLKRNAWQH
ncbi:MAG: ABC transporter permease subunit, partial [Armatimonadota bacterium]